MPVVFLIAIVAVLVGIFFAATGRGGELAYEQTDHAPVDLGPVSAADIALLRPPTAMWGYNMQVTDEALDNIARAMRGRDVTIAFLQEHLATLTRNGSYAEPQGAHARQDLAPGIPSFPEASESSLRPLTSRRFPRSWSLLRPAGPLTSLEAPEILESPQPRWAADVAEVPEVLESPQAHWAADIAEAPEIRRHSRGRRSGGRSLGGSRVPCEAPALWDADFARPQTALLPRRLCGASPDSQPSSDPAGPQGFTGQDSSGPRT